MKSQGFGIPGKIQRGLGFRVWGLPDLGFDVCVPKLLGVVILEVPQKGPEPMAAELACAAPGN